MNEISTYEDKFLIEAFIQGDEKSFEALYRLYYKKIYGNIFKMVKSDDVAKELLQVIFFKLWQKRSYIDVNQSFSSYLYRIAQNEVYSFFRTVARDQKLREQFLQNYTVQNPITSVEKMEEAEFNNKIHQLIDKLPPKRRLIFKMVKIDKLSYEEVSQTLNISKATINDHIVKATKFLQEQISSDPLCLLLFILFC